MISKSLINILIIIIILISISCDIINPLEDIPSYIQIDKISHSEDSNALKITDAWINIDGNLIGIYELPAKFPIIESGVHTIKVRAGIKVNGIAASRAYYPFYTSYETNIELLPTEIIKIFPEVSYADFANRLWVEDFESAGISIEETSDSDAELVFSSDDVFDGYKSGKIFLPDTSDYYECFTINNFILPYNNTPIYLELNYKNSIQFFVGVYVLSLSGSIDKHTIILIHKHTEWNKIYIDLTTTVNNYPESFFKLFIMVIKENKEQSEEIFIDNLRLVTYE
ncbi:MAG: hypothetical protein KAT68_00170 [Bacteroidales bacterium]|nr:hypothetical protein [Bacteroidales bacterium]